METGSDFHFAKTGSAVCVHISSGRGEGTEGRKCASVELPKFRPGPLSHFDKKKSEIEVEIVKHRSR